MKDKESVLKELSSIHYRLTLTNERQRTKLAEEILGLLDESIAILKGSYVFLPENLQEILELDEFSENYQQLQNGQRSISLYPNLPNDICRA